MATRYQSEALEGTSWPVQRETLASWLFVSHPQFSTSVNGHMWMWMHFTFWHCKFYMILQIARNNDRYETPSFQTSGSPRNVPDTILIHSHMCGYDGGRKIFRLLFRTDDSWAAGLSSKSMPHSKAGQVTFSGLTLSSRCQNPNPKKRFVSFLMAQGRWCHKGC